MTELSYFILKQRYKFNPTILQFYKKSVLTILDLNDKKYVWQQQTLNINRKVPTLY